MAERRTIVSYDELYDDSHEQAPTDAQRHGALPDGGATSDDDGEIDDVGSVMANPGAWNDTELIRAWDGAIGDYRKQHAELLGDASYLEQRTAHESAVGKWVSVAASDDSRSSSKCNDQEVKKQHPLAGSSGPAASEPTGSKRKRTEEPAPSALVAGEGPVPPESEQDALHKLTTAWYYAGYYAGYHEVREIEII
ncbi:hypothetical protein LPJ59_006150 [Coemansia sp. RSA 2399]|nr:hypothetical protein LPJ59_006150 [Coemansia sp. RSA 2399]KAJ1889726.1 hypothetical protein LPJ81_006073 [Coemansia sp. IMI 209127]